MTTVDVVIHLPRVACIWASTALLSGRDAVISVEELTWAVGELAEMSTEDFQVDELL